MADQQPEFRFRELVGNPQDYGNNVAVPIAAPAQNGPRYTPFSKAILFIIILIVITLLIVMMFYVFETPKQIIKEICHKSCLRNGPCGSGNCPFADPKNPLRVIVVQQEIAGRYRNDIQRLNSEIIKRSNSSDISDSMKKTLASSIDGNIVSTKNNLAYANSISKAIDKLAMDAINIGLPSSGQSKTLILIQDKIEGLLNAIGTLYYLSIIQARIFQTRLLYTKLDKDKIDIKELADAILSSDYEDKKIKFEQLVKKTSEIVGDVTTPTSNPAIYVASEAMLATSAPEVVDADKIVTTAGVLGDLQGLVIPITAEIENIYGYIKKVGEEYSTESFTERFEGTREPGKVDSEMANKQIEENDYNTTIKQLSLEPSIAENHKVFAAERNRIDSGAGIYGVRDDPNDVIPWVGLFRPTYKRSDGKSAEQSVVPLKAVPSDDPDKQMQERMLLTF